jgi:hypothetical protein
MVVRQIDRQTAWEKWDEAGKLELLNDISYLVLSVGRYFARDHYTDSGSLRSLYTDSGIGNCPIQQYKRKCLGANLPASSMLCCV